MKNKIDSLKNNLGLVFDEVAYDVHVVQEEIKKELENHTPATVAGIFGLVLLTAVETHHAEQEILDGKNTSGHTKRHEESRRAYQEKQEIEENQGASNVAGTLYVERPLKCNFANMMVSLADKFPTLNVK